MIIPRSPRKKPPKNQPGMERPLELAMAQAIAPKERHEKELKQKRWRHGSPTILFGRPAARNGMRGRCSLPFDKGITLKISSGREEFNYREIVQKMDEH